MRLDSTAFERSGTTFIKEQMDLFAFENGFLGKSKNLPP